MSGSDSLLEHKTTDNDDDSDVGSLPENDFMTRERQATEDSHIVVVAKTSNYTNKRTWDKKFPCIFRKQMVAKLPRHFDQVHSTEKQVILLKSIKMIPKDWNCWEHCEIMACTCIILM